MIAVACDCGHEFGVPAKAIGRRVKCPKCREPVSVPVGGMAEALGMDLDAPPRTPPGPAPAPRPASVSQSSADAAAPPELAVLLGQIRTRLTFIGLMLVAIF